MEDDVRNGKRFVNRQWGTPCIITEELEYRTPLGTPDGELSQPIADDSAMEELAEKIRSALDKLKDAVSDDDKIDDTIDEIRKTYEDKFDNEAEAEVGYEFGDGELSELIRGVLDKIDIESSQKNNVSDKFDDRVKDDVDSVVEDQFNVVFDNRTNEKSEGKDDNKYEHTAVDNVTYRYMDTNHSIKCDKIDGIEAANDEVAKHSKDYKGDSIFGDKENSDNKYRETDDGNDCELEKYSSDYEFNDKIKDKFNNIENYNSDKNIYGRIGIGFNGKVDKKFEDVEEKFKLGDDDDKKFSNVINDDKISNKEIEDKGEYESKHETIIDGNKGDDIVEDERDNDIDNKLVNENDDTVDDEIGDTDYKIESEDECAEAVILRNNFDDKVDEIDNKRDQDDVVEGKFGDQFEWKDDEEVVRSITKKKVKKGENNWLYRLNCRKEHNTSIEDFTLDTLESRVTRPTDLQKKEKLRRVRKLFGCFSCTRVPGKYMRNLSSLVYRMR